MDTSAITTCDLPQDSLLRNYSQSGAYTDCYVIDVAQPVSQAEYVEAFYMTWAFKLERLLLAWFVSRPSTDAQARALASGERDSFAAWEVEGRTANQLLMCDLHGRTRSWLMSDAIAADATAVTRLYFGSAVVPLVRVWSGTRAMGLIFRVMLGFHRIYSRVLLRAAVSRLGRRA